MRLQLQENSQKASLGYALTSNQPFFRSSPVTPPVTGKITITGGVGAGLYSDLASAIAYINTFTGATVTDATLVGGVFKFTVPANSDFSNAVNFLPNANISFTDTDGLITKFGEGAFKSNSGTVTLIDAEFGNLSLQQFSGTLNINNILLTNSNDEFGADFAGTMNVTGNIGTTEGNDYANFFVTLKPPATGTINAKVAKQTSNGGSPEGDLALANINGASVNYTL
jgi:hypothetical protein